MEAMTSVYMPCCTLATTSDALDTGPNVIPTVSAFSEECTNLLADASEMRPHQFSIMDELKGVSGRVAILERCLEGIDMASIVRRIAHVEDLLSRDDTMKSKPLTEVVPLSLSKDNVDAATNPKVELEDMKRKVNIDAEAQGEVAAEDFDFVYPPLKRDSIGSVIETKREYILKRSIWDATLLLGASEDGSAQAAFSFMLVVANLCVQGVFAAIVYDKFTEADYEDDSVKALRSWRRNIAHDIRYMDRLSLRSLASRVCYGDPGLELSEGQSRAFSELVSYLDTNQFAVIGVGPVMCVLALVLWFLCVSKEFSNIAAFVLSVMSLKRAKFTTLYDHCIETVTSCRVAVVLMLQLCRLVITGVLLVAGSIFLINTVSVGDLLLNSVMLECVLQIDELIFEALAPLLLRRRLSVLEPLRLPLAKVWRGLDCQAALAVLFVTTGLAMSMWGLGGQIAILEEARDMLCAGDLDFAYTLNGFGIPTWTNTTSSVDRKREDGFEVGPWPWREGDSLSFTNQVIESVLGADFKEDFKEDALRCDSSDLFGTNISKCLAKSTVVPQIIAGRFSLDTVNEETPGEAFETWNPACRDILDSGDVTSYILLLVGSISDAVGGGQLCNASHPLFIGGACVVPRCRDLEQYCRLETMPGTRARQMCPVTCGCADPLSPLILTAAQFGCGAPCKRTTEYTSNLEAMPCEDTPVGDDRLLDYSRELRKVGESWPVDWQRSVKMFWGPLFEVMGCRTVTSTWQGSDIPMVSGRADFCIEGGSWLPIKPLSYLCPVTCACRGGSPHCPTSCPRTARPSPHLGPPTALWLTKCEFTETVFNGRNTSGVAEACPARVQARLLQPTSADGAVASSPQPSASASKTR